MNRSAILAAGVALMVGLWSGLVLARVGGGAAGPAPGFVGGAAEGVRAASAPRFLAPGPDGMAFMRVRLDTSTAQPKACLEFSRPLQTDGVDLKDYVTLLPEAPFAAEVDGSLLCLAGLPFEPDREVTVRAGLPAADGSKTADDETFTLSFGDRPSFVGFAGNGVILPRAEADGVGIETVNVTKMKLTVMRIGDRALVREALESGQAIEEGSWDYWSLENAGADNGEKVFEGTIDVPAKDPKSGLDQRNQTVTTVFALGAALKQFKPGAYVVRAEDASPGAGSRGQQNDRPAGAFRWILYTDLALQTFTGATGADVIVRSLQTARPVGGVTLTLIAQNGEELARARTDGDGRGRFASAALKGEGAMRPRTIMAYGAGGDFAALDLERPTLDLTDRDVSGRSTPGDVDAYMYTERGIYRPGETVRVTGLIRDGAGRAISGRLSTLVVYRPNGTEARRERLNKAVDAGAIIKNVAIDRAAPRGAWRAALEVDGQTGEAGSVSFTVEDFVPQRLKVDATAAATPMAGAETRPIQVNAQFLYGAPGSGLAVTGEARIALDPNPFPAEKGFTFGKQDEEFAETFFELPPTVTDGDGRAQLQFALQKIPQTTLPLRARVVASVAEPGGRQVREGFQIPIRLSQRYIGVKPKFEAGRVAAGASAAFDVIAVDAGGRRVGAGNISWTLVREEWNYDWYLDNGQWRWRRTGRDIPVSAGAVTVAADKPGVIAQEKLREGSYRLILTDTAANAQTTHTFYAGWGAGADGDTPDMVAILAPPEPVKPGGNIRLQIKPPYPGEAQIVIASDRVLSTRTIRVGAEGATVNVRADPAWGAGVYVLATVVTPRSPAALPVPRRAIGVAYVPFDMGARTIKLAFDEKMGVLRPRQKVEVPITVSGAPGGERVRVTLAAVDEGILQLTKFESPDPTKWYFGRKGLGVDVRDDYGRLLNPNLGAPAIARQGGDSLGGEGLTVVPTKTVALWTGLVKLDRQGKTTIPLDLPDFNGQLRLMAVAWSETGLGAVAAPVTVRDPVVAELTLPRFIAPGDAANATLEVANVDGAAGEYRVSVAGTGAAAMQAVTQAFSLAQGAQTRVRVPLSGAAPGIGKVSLTLDGPQGLKITRDYDIQSRAPYLPVTLVDTTEQAPGESFRVASDVLAPFSPGEGRAIVSYSALRGIDAAPLYDVLERYPYGCSEQLTSTAMPLLYANALASAAKQPNDPRVRARVQDAVNRLLDRTGSDGAVGLWRAEDRGATPWLGAYVGDFLVRAKAAGYVVPQAALDSVMKGLRVVARLDDFGAVGYDAQVYRWPGSPDTEELLKSRSAAYALYVLAKAGKTDLGQVRYFHDAKLRAEPSPLARAQIGAALAHLGDRARAGQAFRAAEQALGWRNAGDYYQTPLRDLAGMVALAAEAGDQEAVARFSARLDREGKDAPSLTTQEQSQLLMAADALLKRAGPVSISVNGQPGQPSTMADAASVASGLVFANAGKGPVFRTLTRSGPPREAPPAAANGFSLDKRMFRLDGSLSDGVLRQGDRVVIVLSGGPDGERLVPAVLVDLLPAGLEIEEVLTPADGAATGPDSAGGLFRWVGELTSTRVAEARDDRFVAAADLRGRGFRVAYVARAVTPGAFTLPAAQIEDMYRPGVFARTAPGRISIEAR